jgi:hypothetical protein
MKNKMLSALIIIAVFSVAAYAVLTQSVFTSSSATINKYTYIQSETDTLLPATTTTISRQCKGCSAGYIDIGPYADVNIQIDCTVGFCAGLTVLGSDTADSTNTLIALNRNMITTYNTTVDYRLFPTTLCAVNRRAILHFGAAAPRPHLFLIQAHTPTTTECTTETTNEFATKATIQTTIWGRTP